MAVQESATSNGYHEGGSEDESGSTGTSTSRVRIAQYMPAIPARMPVPIGTRTGTRKRTGRQWRLRCFFLVALMNMIAMIYYSTSIDLGFDIGIRHSGGEMQDSFMTLDTRQEESPHSMEHMISKEGDAEAEVEGYGNDKSNIGKDEGNSRDNRNAKDKKSSDKDTYSKLEDIVKVKDKRIESNKKKEKDEDTNQEKDNGKKIKANTTYEPLAPHPHAGARHPDGRYGYVADVTAVRKQHFKMLEDWRRNNKNQELLDDDNSMDLVSNSRPSAADPARGSNPEQDQNGDTFDSHRMRLTLGEKMYNYVCNKPIGEGTEKVEGFKLMQKLQIGGPAPRPNPIPVNVTSNDTGSIDNSTHMSVHMSVEGIRLTGDNNEHEERDTQIQTKPKPRLLCVVYTYEAHHATQLQAVVNTWAWKCDGFVAASTATNATLGAVDLPHVGDEAYDNMWQKSRSIWAYIHDNYVDEYDYFWLGGDDYGLVVENLRGVLEDHTKESNPYGANENNVPVYLGLQMPQLGGNHFCVGGPGYVLNRVTVKRLITALPACEPTKKTSAEDRCMSNCLRDIGILCGDTADAKGQQRFTGVEPNYLATHKGERGYYKKVYDFWGKTNGGFKWGVNLYSEQSIGFHNLRYPAFMHRIHALQYPWTCPTKSTIGQTLNATKYDTVI